MPNLRLKSSHNARTNYSASTSSLFSAASLHRRASMVSKKHPELMARTPLQHYQRLITETITFKPSTSAHLTMLSIYPFGPPADLSCPLAVSQSISRSVISHWPDLCGCHIKKITTKTPLTKWTHQLTHRTPNPLLTLYNLRRSVTTRANDLHEAGDLQPIDNQEIESRFPVGSNKCLILQLLPLRCAAR